MTRLLSVSGWERNYLEKIQQELKEYTDECYFDRFGNLVAHKAGKGKKLMICCGADECGFVVSHIGKEGQIFVSKLGTFSEKDSARVVSERGLEGILSSGDEIQVLIGAESAEEAEKAVEIGEIFGYSGDRTENEYAYFGPAADQLLAEQFIQTIRQITDYKNDLYFVFAVQSKLGGRGEKTAACSIQPDSCYLFRFSDTKKILTDDKNTPAVRLRDKTTVYDKALCDKIIKACRDNKIPMQPEIYDEKDIGAGNLKLSGTDLAVITFPVENKNTQNELVRKKNILFTGIIINILTNLD